MVASEKKKELFPLVPKEKGMVMLPQFVEQFSFEFDITSLLAARATTNRVISSSTPITRFRKSTFVRVDH